MNELIAAATHTDVRHGAQAVIISAVCLTIAVGFCIIYLNSKRKK